MDAPSLPLHELGDFPQFALLPAHTLRRIHRAMRGPWWFSSGTDRRFDLPAPNGTCYLAEDTLGAFVEAFQTLGVVIPEQEILARRVSTLAVPSSIRLADCTDSRARGFGLTSEIHASTNRALTRAWAAAFAAAGFDGIRYLVRHDPAQRRVGVALFGPAGEATWPIMATDALSVDLVLAVQDEFGLRILPLRS